MASPEINPRPQPETVERILDYSGTLYPGEESRVPLYINFQESATDLPPDEKRPDVYNPFLFNAVGSLVAKYTALPDMGPGAKMHRPVIDIDRQVSVLERAGLTRIVIKAGRLDSEYTADNWLRPLFARMDVDVEVFTRAELDPGVMGSSVDSYVAEVALTAETHKKRLFVARSATEGHAHLYINGAQMRWDDYLELLRGFNKVGVVGKSWLKQSEDQGMTIVRTPWNLAPKTRSRS